MTIIYNATVRTARLNVVQLALQAGAAAAQIRLRTSGNAVLVSVSVDDPVLLSGDVLTLLDDVKTGVASGTGTAANAILVDSDGNIVASGLTVGTSGADVIVDNTSIVTGQNVNVNAATITHPSS